MKLGPAKEAWLLLSLGLLLVIGFHALGDAVYGGWALGLGSIRMPTTPHLFFLAHFAILGSAVTLVVAAGLIRKGGLASRWEGWDDRVFLACAVVAGLLVPLALRTWVLDGVRLTDDESLYRFAATLLTQGRLSAPSHPMRLFFDHAFLVNDGHMYTQYFLGWPAFLSIGVALGAPGVVNAVLSALTVPALYLLLRELTDRRWAQLVVLIFLTSPMLQLLAATELSHTSALMALTWTAWLGLRASQAPDDPRWAALLGLGFSVAFFVRPLTALGIGLPFLAVGVLGWWRGGRRPASALAFAAPTLLLAAAFLAVNEAQTGSMWKPAYVATREYARANAYRFSGLDPHSAPIVPNLGFHGLGGVASNLAEGVGRLNFALLGWPTAFLFLPMAVGGRGTGVLWASMGSFLLLHLALTDSGIDTVGPVHFTELALPVLALTAVGIARGSQALASSVRSGGGSVTAIVAALVLCSLTMYSPVRLRAVSVAVGLVKVPKRALEAREISNAVVFSSMPYAAGCSPTIPSPSRPFVLWWPVNEPALDDTIVHANHLSVERDRELMKAHFPHRTGWIMHWGEGCTLNLVNVGGANLEQIPNGLMITGSGAPIRYDESHPPTGEVPAGFSPVRTP